MVISDLIIEIDNLNESTFIKGYFFEKYEEISFFVFKKLYIYNMFHVNKIYKITHPETKANFWKKMNF